MQIAELQFAELPTRTAQKPIGNGRSLVSNRPESYHQRALSATLASSRIETRPNWAEISLSALRHNFRVLQRHVGPNVTICAVVKCNAYGHGVEECAPALAEAGATWFGVTSTDEAIVLREAGIAGRILVMCGL